MRVTGGCLCGAVRYEAQGEPMFAGLCHCRDCQRVSGSSHVAILGMPRAGFRATGEIRRFTVTGSSGHPTTRCSCPVCGSTLFGEPGMAPDMIPIYVGGLDDLSLYRPEISIYTRSRPSWGEMACTLEQFEGSDG